MKKRKFQSHPMILFWVGKKKSFKFFFLFLFLKNSRPFKNISKTAKLHSTHDNKTVRYSKNKTSKTSFIVEHYAGKVEYEIKNFLDKSKNTIQQDLIELCCSSKDPFLAGLLAEKKEDKKVTMSPQSKMTVGLLFKVIFCF